MGDGRRETGKAGTGKGGKGTGEWGNEATGESSAADPKRKTFIPSVASYLLVGALMPRRGE